VRDQGLDQSQAKATASAGDDGILIFEAHQPCSSLRYITRTIEARKRSHIGGIGGMSPGTDEGAMTIRMTTPVAIGTARASAGCCVVSAASATQPR
jgi:hypothetical protein